MSDVYETFRATYGHLLTGMTGQEKLAVLHRLRAEYRILPSRKQVAIVAEGIRREARDEGRQHQMSIFDGGITE